MCGLVGNNIKINSKLYIVPIRDKIRKVELKL